jgi:hypothetical protein
MAENVLKEPIIDPNGGDEKKGGGFFSSLLNGSYLTFDRSPGLLPFLLFFTVLAVCLIANTYYAERKVREFEAMRNEVTELRTIYISNKAELMYLSNQSDVARRLSQQGFIESTVPPRILPDGNRRGEFIYKMFRRNSN